MMTFRPNFDLSVVFARVHTYASAIRAYAIAYTPKSAMKGSVLNHHYGLIEIPRIAVFLSRPRPVKHGSLNQTVRKYPALFGVPFVLIVVASYHLGAFIQTRYDLHD